MTRELQSRGHSCSENRIARLMQEHDLRAQAPPRFVPRTTDSQHDLPIAPNRLAERCAPDGPNQVWLQDFTYVPTAQGWLYLALVLDLWSRKIVGWAMAGHKIGHSVVAAAAYRSGSNLWDERQGKTQNYARRSKGVVESDILRPEGSPEWVADPESLWNRVEAAEKRKDAQLAREFILAVPPELSKDEQFQLAVAWAQKELVASGMIAEVSLHHSQTGNNPHVHILCTMRKLDGDNFSAKKAREWNAVPVLDHWRESWADAVNAALEKAGRSERVDHRSLKDQGIDRIPEPKIGKEAMGLKKRGVVEDPERFKLVRYVKSLNFARPWFKAIEKSGEVYQQGMGNSWWERSLIFASKAREAVRETVMDTWSKLLTTRHGRESLDIPPRDRGPDMDR